MKRRKRLIKIGNLKQCTFVVRPELSESVLCAIIIFIPILCPFSAFLCQSKNLICYKGRLEMIWRLRITYFPALLHLILHETIVNYCPMTHQHQLGQVQQNAELDPRPQGDDFEKPVRFFSMTVRHAMWGYLCQHLRNPICLLFTHTKMHKILLCNGCYVGG